MAEGSLITDELKKMIGVPWSQSSSRLKKERYKDMLRL